MNKAELIQAVAAKAKSSKAAVENIVNAFTGTVASALKRKDKVTLVGFGTFGLSSRAARMGRNPQTGEQIKIKASKNVKFKAGKDLKNQVNR
ncbi:MAG: HU family DNA-binding protein [Deltaproteobacteria bacterium]|nr:HU family DNA-binding protein [Deltaproteobacteria bacterium]